MFHRLVIDQGCAWFHISFTHWSASRVLVVAFPVTGALLILPLARFFASDLRFAFAEFLERVNLEGAKARSAARSAASSASCPR